MQGPVSTYIDSDDGVHPFDNPDYYEWWYLDARFDNGYSCVLTWHWRNEFLKPHIPTIQIFIYTPEGKRYVGLDAVDIKDCSASRERCDVKMGSSYLRQENGLYKMSMHSRNVGCELTYKGVLPGWKSDDGHFPGGALPRGFAGWVIPCPRASVEGKLIIKGQEIPVKGDGYHDHNWGDIDLYELFKGKDVALDCRLDTRQVAEHSPLPKVNEFDMFNWRFLANYEGQITVDGKSDRFSGERIHERLLFRP